MIIIIPMMITIINKQIIITIPSHKRNVVTQTLREINPKRFRSLRIFFNQEIMQIVRSCIFLSFGYSYPNNIMRSSVINPERFRSLRGAERKPDMAEWQMHHLRSVFIISKYVHSFQDGKLPETFAPPNTPSLAFS